MSCSVRVYVGLLLALALSAGGGGVGVAELAAPAERTSEASSYELSAAAPYAIGTVAIDEMKTYRYAVESSAARHTITLQPVTGNPDLRVWFAEPGNQPCAAQSLQGPLMTDRVSFSPKEMKGKSLITIQVAGSTQSQFILSVTTTEFHVSTPASTGTHALKVRADEQFGDSQNLLTYLSISNQSAAWYEVSIAGTGDLLKRSSVPASFILGPKQTRMFPWVCFTPEDTVSVAVDRTSRTALIYFTCDLTARFVNGGAGLPNTLPDDLQNLIPRMQPLADVGSLFVKGDAIRGSARLVAVVRKDPKTLAALYQFLKRSGLGISQSALSGKLLSGFGPISAMIQGVSSLKSPEREKVALRAVPD